MRILLILLVSIILNTINAFASTSKELSKETVVPCIVGESESEGYIGMLAVSEAIRNRKTLKGVFGCNAPRVKLHKYSPHTLVLAIKAWDESKHSNITKGATHWEGTKFKIPYWAKSCQETVVIKNQRFYKCK